jgi:hypothetical protein
MGAALLDAGRAQEALGILSELYRQFPSGAVALRLAQAELACGNLQSAADRLRQWTQRLTDMADQCLCAELLARARCDAEAASVAARIARERPDAWMWSWRFAGHFRAKGDLGASRTVLTAMRDAQQDPALRLRAELGLALGLPAFYRDVAEVQQVRQNFSEGLTAITERYAPATLSSIGATPEHLSWDNFLLPYQGEDDLPLQARFGQWMVDSFATLLPQFAAAPDPTLRTKPRLAMVSNRFHACTIGFYFASWVEYLARGDWEVMLVHVGTRRDALTERLGRSAHHEMTLQGTLAQNARMLRDLEADIILYPELGMDRETFALAALRLAPRQVCAWGHPVTTGLPTIDDFLSCAEMEPEDAEGHYSERLLLLPGIGTRYLAPPVPPAPTRAALGLPSDRTLYLVPQALYKLHPDNDERLVEILRRDSRALFVLFELNAPSPALRLRQRLLAALGQVTAQPERHLRWFGECSRADYLRINLVCDVMIDSAHWSGGNATLDALHCGLPVITCPGRFMRSRQSAAMLRAIGCEELVAESTQELAGVAVALANNPARRSELRTRILDRLPSLTQSDAPLEVLDRRLKELLERTREP